MCNCQKANTEAAINYVSSTLSDKLKVDDQQAAGLVNQALHRTGNKLVAISFDEYAVWVQPVKKDGSLGNPKKQKVTFVHSYCPHCGEKYAQ